MFNKENWIYLCINTIIIATLLMILFRYQDNKLKLYFKKLEKKIINNTQQYNKINDINEKDEKDYNNKIDKTENNIISQENKIPMDIDSFIDPLDN
jgi:uncharacterized protein with ParB-like and HNH nuclease domain